MQTMGQHMHFRLAPGLKFAVHPDPAVAIVVRNESHVSCA